MTAVRVRCADFTAGSRKALDTVTDRFDSRHRRTPAGEGLEQQPGANGGGREVQRGRSNHGCRMTACGERLDQSQRQSDQQASDEEIGRKDKHCARLADATQVDDRHEQQDHQAHQQSVRLQGWNGGDERPDTRRDPHGGSQHVVNHQRRGRKQPGKLSEIFAGHRVGAATCWVSLNSLAIGEVNDPNEEDDDAGDGYKVSNSSRAQRDE